MKFNLKCPKANYCFNPYVLNRYGSGEELSFTLADVQENMVFAGEHPAYIDVICSIDAHNEFTPATVSASYRNELDESLAQMAFNLYDNSSVNMNGIVSSIDIVIQETEVPIDKKVVYTKTFNTTQSQVINVRETPNYSGIDTVSDTYFFGGAYKPNMPLPDIQPYLFYLTHRYNTPASIGIISATDFLNSKNNLTPASNVKFEDLSTLYDDIATGKIQIVLNDALYKSVSAIKNTLTSPLFTIKFKSDI